MPNPSQRAVDKLQTQIPDSDEVTALIEAGIAADAAGNAGAAEALFRRAIALWPRSARAHMNLGIVLQDSGDLSAAALAHAEAVRLDPGSANAHYNLALARLGLGDVPGAERGFRDSLAVKAEFPEAWVGLAEALESAGRNEEALAALDSAIAQRPRYAGAIFNAGILLRKLGRLDEAEMDIMRQHASLGHELLKGSSSRLLQAGATIALGHHEKFDGSGYPQGLSGEDIPLFGRIVAVADVFDALTSERPYKKPWSLEDAADYLRAQRGLHFDPQCVDVFLAAWPQVLAIRQRFADEPKAAPA